MSGRIRHPDGYKIRFHRELGLAIRKQRQRANMSLKRLAEACGVGESTVDKWEDGTTSVPAYALHRMEIAFQCNLYDLMPVMGDGEAAA